MGIGSLKKITVLFCFLFVMSTGKSSSGQAAIPKAQKLPQIATVLDWCLSLSKTLKSVDYNKCKERPWLTDGRSTSSLIIPHMFLGPEDGRHVLILGGIHGDELSSVSIVFRWMDFMDKVRQESPLRKVRFMFLPLANPDGFWSNPRTRTNIVGVDLNRNFSTKGWSTEAHHYWKHRTGQDRRRYPGPKPSSEIETQLLEKYVEEFKPEMIVSVHAPYGILDHDGPVQLPKNLKSPLPVKTLGAFPGSLGRYSGIDRNVPVMTVELMTSGTLPNSQAIEELFVYVLNSKGQGLQAVVR